MPIRLPPISRRTLLQATLAGGVAITAARRADAAEAGEAKLDPHRVALLADTHVAADAARVVNETNVADHLRRACNDVLRLAPLPMHALINGDFALKDGQSGDYATAVKLLDPLRSTGIAVHVALGNHDHRERFRAAIGGQNEAKRARLVKDKHVALLRMPRVNWLILDSLDVTDVVRGALGAEQLRWLADTLDAHLDKPAIVMVHHYPERPGDTNPTGIAETAALFDLLSARTQAKALLYGHSHRWSHQRRDDGLHLVNLPATAYVFDKAHPSAWVDARIEESGATFELHCLDEKHPWQGEKLKLDWREKK